MAEENFTTAGDAPFQGRSLSVYHAGSGMWKQTWVDNSGGFLDFEGQFEGDRMILSRKAVKDGKNFIQRMVFYNIAADSLDWNWERSFDEGKTWEVLWKIHYQRRS